MSWSRQDWTFFSFNSGSVILTRVTAELDSMGPMSENKHWREQKHSQVFFLGQTHPAKHYGQVSQSPILVS